MVLSIDIRYLNLDVQIDHTFFYHIISPTNMMKV